MWVSSSQVRRSRKIRAWGANSGEGEKQDKAVGNGSILKGAFLDDDVANISSV